MWPPRIVTRFHRAASRQRLWMAGVALAVFLLTLVIGNLAIPDNKAVKSEMLGHDFLAFYTAGTFVRQGRSADLYNLNSVRVFEQATSRAADVDLGDSFGPWWNPPFYALVFEPLARLPYLQALKLWRWISIAFMAIAIVLLSLIVMRSSLSTRWQQWGLVPLLVLISMPFIQAISHGQNTASSLLLLTATVWLWRIKRTFLAGACCGLLFYKPQLGAVVAAVMALDLGATALAGLAVTGTFLLLTTLIVMPGSLNDWLHQLPMNVHWMQVENTYLWERHVTLKAFWRMLLQGRGAGESSFFTTALTWLTLAAIAGGLARAIFVGRRASTNEKVRRDRLITATVTAMPLLMPFYFDYDLLLLAVPAVLYASERMSNPDRMMHSDRWMTARWAALFAWLYVNPAFALHTHFNLSVILLCSVAIGSIKRVNRADGEAIPMAKSHPQPMAMAA